MSQAIQELASLRQRFDVLEKEFAALRDRVLGTKPVRKDWRSTVGMLPDDELSREAQRLGAEWRRNGAED
ncbi:hypothetical protein [Prosthecobacter sp.]|uniref:hypothetical protein n=1 Tax=Prosthecobacter sp. TaxID=1965333 RepID=UPI003782DE6E